MGQAMTRSKPQRIGVISSTELLSRLKRTRLRGFDQAEVYRHAVLTLEPVEIAMLLPTQTYVLKHIVELIEGLADSLGVFSLDGALIIDGVPFLPPIVEESLEGLIINDGMHRVWAARKRGTHINAVVIRNVPPQYPYYAYPLENGWAGVAEVDEQPDVKKRYRDPENYKALFRDFNEAFPGVQRIGVERKERT